MSDRSEYETIYCYNVGKLLEYYMGKNTMERQGFIIDNLVVEEDLADEDTNDL